MMPSERTLKQRVIYMPVPAARSVQVVVMGKVFERYKSKDNLLWIVFVCRKERMYLIKGCTCL